MRYSLLTYLRCPVCGGELACRVAREVATPIHRSIEAVGARAPQSGSAWAAAPAARLAAALAIKNTPLTARLQELAGAPAPERNREVEVESGLLICYDCVRWFPIDGTLPELLPDHLRDAASDRAHWLELAALLPADVRPHIVTAAASDPAADGGAHYKRAEMSIVDKIANPTEFFGPGQSAPFNPDNTEFTLYLLSLFGNVVRLLDVDHIPATAGRRPVVVDSGCGYAWTSEWMARSGITAIGLDICRPYLDVAVQRIGPARPHLVVADVEHLPLAPASVDAVLGFESFHHIPNRATAMAGYARALRDGGTVLLAEPGDAHETAPVSVETMTRYGILEKGMELADVRQYAAGLPFSSVEQHYVVHGADETFAPGVFLPSVWRHSLVHGNLFRLRKGTPSGAATAPVADSRDWAAELRRTVAERHALKVALDAAENDLAVARHTVATMRQSAFWRLRGYWVWLASLAGSRRGDVPREAEHRPHDSGGGC